MIDGTCPGQPGKPRVLVYTYENQWRHLSNLDARAAICNLNVTRGFKVDTSNDPRIMNATQLAGYDVVVFAVTSGIGIPVGLHPDFEAWAAHGGGIVGLHSADSTEQAWDFYVKTMGAQFMTHAPGLIPATVRIVPENAHHPIVDGLVDFPETDEWYFFSQRPESFPGMDMLLAVDETTLPADGPAKVGFHPIGWSHELYGGRTFFTAMGHNPADYSDPTFMEIVGRAIEWAAHQR